MKRKRLHPLYRARHGTHANGTRYTREIEKERERIRAHDKGRHEAVARRLERAAWVGLFVQHTFQCRVYPLLVLRDVALPHKQNLRDELLFAQSCGWQLRGGCVPLRRVPSAVSRASARAPLELERATERVAVSRGVSSRLLCQRQCAPTRWPPPQVTERHESQCFPKGPRRP